MEKRKDLDDIVNEIGYVGKTQILCFALICFIGMLTGAYSVSYAFTAGDLNYRCYIQDCDGDDPNTAEFEPGWIKYAVPYDKDKDLPEKCLQYVFRGRHNESGANCESGDFDRTYEQKCNKFVYETDEQTILRTFDLNCNDNKWKLSLSGTLQNFGMMCNLLIIGYLSDTFGRKIVFIISPILAFAVSMVQIFAWDYWSYLALKFIETFLSAGSYTTGLILALELINPKYRGFVGTIMFGAASMGKVFLGVIAMLLPNWKTLTIVIFIPSLATLAYYWILPESLKWLAVKERYQDIATILLRISRWNNVTLSDETRDILENHPNAIAAKIDDPSQDENAKIPNVKYPIKELIKSPTMLLRVIGLSYCWITNIFIFYGLTLISVTIGGNKYTNFMLVNFMEVIACILVMFILNRVGRKKLICTAYIVSGLALLSYTFIEDSFEFKLVVFMIGKFAITISFTTMYVYTTEVFPTCLRQTLVGVCSAFGRIGSMTAPQAPLLDLVTPDFSIYVFGTIAFIAGVITIFFPETLNTKLPDTIDEALNIGKKTETTSKEELVT